MEQIISVICCASLICTCGAVAAPSSTTETRVYEMRTYYAAPGKLDDLNARFRNHTTKLFQKHGMTNIGYWVPLENPDNKLIYILAYPSREARDKSWKTFMADPEWQAAAKASEASGKLVSKVESVFLQTTDYSPPVRPSPPGQPRIFELRTYQASPGNLGKLNARFRNHTLGLFSKHGMSHIGYWTLMPDQKGADDTLIYILAHKSHEAAKASFDAFRNDPLWQKARKESEVDGPLTAKIESLFMRATDYSTIK